MATRSIQIIDLSDEVLVHIFSFLSSCDVINLEKTCKRIQRICYDKKVIGYMNFSRAYKLCTKHLKTFFCAKLRCANVIEINFNYCHWYQASVFGIISKLKNLKHLHILDCRVSLNCLQNILNGLTLKSLSWTLDSRIRKNDLNDNFKDTFSRLLCDLQSLKIHIISPFQLSQICFLLQCCKQLQSVEVLESASSFSESLTSCPCHAYTLELRSLIRSKFILRSSLGVDVKRFIHKILNSTNLNEQLNGFWAAQGGCSVLLKLYEEDNLLLSSLQNTDFLSLDGCYDGQSSVIRTDRNAAFSDFAKKVLNQNKGLPNCRQLSLAQQRLDSELLCLVARNCTQLEFLNLKKCHVMQLPSEICEELMTVGELNKKLTALNLVGTHIHSSSNPCEFLNSIKNLQVLALPACMLTWIDENKDTSKEEQNKSFVNFKSAGNRQGIKSTLSDEEIKSSRLFSVTENCPKLKTLIIEGDSHTSYCEKICQNVTEKEITCISNWKNLEILILKNLPGINSGKFLLNLCENCSRLYHLNLIDVGPKGVCKYVGYLIQALQYCSNLEDLRIEQKSGVNFTHLHNGLRFCKKLHRFALMCVHSGSECALTEREIIKMLDEMPNLISLRLVIPFKSEAHCNRLSQILEKHFSISRPAFKTMFIPPEKYRLRERQQVFSWFHDEIMQSILNVNSLMTF